MKNRFRETCRDLEVIRDRARTLEALARIHEKRINKMVESLQVKSDDNVIHRSHEHKVEA